jgi:hypothetical protein
MFPRLRKQLGTKFQTIPYKQQFEDFYNLVLIPSFAQIDNLTCRYELPLSYEISELRGQQGGFLDKRVSMLGRELSQAFDFARDLVDSSENPAIQMFQGFFFHFDIKAVKNYSKAPIDDFDYLFDRFASDLGLDWALVRSDELNSCFFDVGIEFNPPSGVNPMTALWNGQVLKRLMTVPGYNTPVEDQYMYSREIFGVTASVKDTTVEKFPDTPRYIQCYFLDKSALYIHRDSSASYKNLTVHHLVTEAKYWDRKLGCVADTFSQMQTKNWGLRYESRVPLSCFPLDPLAIKEKVYIYVPL